ncbi:MAG TPA: hypothetical protein VGK52_12405 [Polyangia bacterium]
MRRHPKQLARASIVSPRAHAVADTFLGGAEFLGVARDPSITTVTTVTTITTVTTLLPPTVALTHCGAHPFKTLVHGALYDSARVESVRTARYLTSRSDTFDGGRQSA